MSTKKSNRKKSLALLFGGSTVVVVIVLMSSLRFDQFDFFPGTKNELSINTYHEILPDDGQSYSKYEFLDNNSLSFQYNLTSKKEEPFAALFLHKKEGVNPFFDFSKYNEITISLSAREAKRIPIYFTVDYEGFTTPNANDDLTSMPFNTIIDYEGPGEYTLSIDQFETPSWWYRHHKKVSKRSKEEFQNFSFERVNYFVVGSCQVLGSNKNDEIIINTLDLGNNNSVNYLIAGILWLVLTIASLVWYYLGKKEKVLVPIKLSEIDEKTNEDRIDQLTNYIAVNYSDPDLKSSKINAELGISTRDVGLLIKENYHTSFKNYLNTVRLTEVKRLLKESNLSVSEIAYSCGYNNISHFNRLFKSEIGISPKAYRDAVPE